MSFTSGFSRKTISDSITFSGCGVHTGEPVLCTLLPAKSGQGIIFEVGSEQETPNYKVPVSVQALELADRATKLVSLEDASQFVLTPEHLLSAVYAFGITDLTIHLTHFEVPIMDGSALVFCEEIQRVGVLDLKDPIDPYCIEEPFFFTHESATIYLLPYDGFKVTSAIEYPGSVIGTQVLSLSINPKTYLSEIAMARTYGFRKDYDYLRQQGLAGGASEENVLIVEDDAYFNGPRIDQECVRHKCLDIIGDFSLLGRPFKGHIVAVKSGHQSHALCLQAHLKA